MAKRGIPFGKRPPGAGGPEWPSAPNQRTQSGPPEQGPPGRAQPQRPGPQPARRPPIHTVHQAIEMANRALERAIVSLWIEGEVSNLVLPRSGHAYFTLKDASAALPTAMWATSVRRLRFRLEEGQRLRVFGRFGIYAAQGRFQFYADRAEPAGLGELTLQLEQLKRRLAAEGLFASERKRSLPPWPKLIGVVTSPSGAAIHDILEVVRRRMPTRVLLSPAKVQGPEAPLELIAALRRLSRVEAVDVIIIGRGGGSLEDLWAFNHEGLARAIADCPKPVISAVGHEVDVTICDLVADRRAATPSQAAELVVPDRQAVLDRLADRRRRLVRGLERRTVDLGSRLHHGSSRLERWGQALLRRERQHLAEAKVALVRGLQARLQADRRRHRALSDRLRSVDPRVRIARQRAVLRELERRLLRAGEGLTAGPRLQLARAAGKLDALSPLAVLGRGYALVRDDDGRVIRGADMVAIGDPLDVTLARGRLRVRVDGRAEEDDRPDVSATSRTDDDPEPSAGSQP